MREVGRRGIACRLWRLRALPETLKFCDGESCLVLWSEDFYPSSREVLPFGACVKLLCYRIVSLLLLAKIATDGPVETPVLLGAETKNSASTGALPAPASTPSLPAREAPGMVRAALLTDGILPCTTCGSLTTFL